MVVVLIRRPVGEAFALRCDERRAAWARGADGDRWWTANLGMDTRVAFAPVVGMDGVRRFRCRVCGVSAEWAAEWAWRGTARSVRAGAWEDVLTTCSAACREVVERRVGRGLPWKWVDPLYRPAA